MLNVNTIAPSVQMISYTESRQRRANCYVLGEHELLLVEPSCETEGLEWLALVAKWNTEKRHIVGIVLTHWHPDHVLGLSALASQLTDRQIQVFAPAYDKAHFAFETVGEGNIVHGWRVLHTPGHSDEHVCLSKGSTLVAGDMVSEGGAIAFDDTAYRASYARLQKLRPSVVLPGHGTALWELPDQPKILIKLLKTSDRAAVL
jgi:glyoxylase-like metal-dependent hydrolase (beta-lactamase superfamily II)